MLDQGATAALQMDSILPQPARKMAEYAVSRPSCISARSTPIAAGRISATSDGSTDLTKPTSMSVLSNNSVDVTCFPNSATVLTSNGSKSMRDLDKDSLPLSKW